VVIEKLPFIFIFLFFFLFGSTGIWSLGLMLAK
jgi:hypothetical protein